MIARLRLLTPLAWRSLWRNPRRTIITVLVVAVGVWSILMFAVMLRAWSLSSRDTTLKLMTGEGEIHAVGYLDDSSVGHRMPAPSSALMAALHSSSVSAFALRVRVNAIVQSEYKTLPMTFVGVTPAQERAMSVIPAQIAQGRYLSGPDDIGIVLGANLAKRLKTRLGKRVVVMAQDVNGRLAERAFKVVGLYRATQEAEDEFAFSGLHTAQKFVGIGSDISEIAFDAANDAALDPLLAELRRVAPGRDVQSWHTLAPLAYAVGTFFESFVSMWLWVIVILIAIGIVNTQLMAVFERAREFGLLRALGMRSRLVLADVALESAFLTGAGVIAGLLLAVASVQAFPHGLDLGFLGRGAEMVGAGRILYPRIEVGDFALFSLIVWVLGVIAALWPAWRASKVSPVEALGRE